MITRQQAGERKTSMEDKNRNEENKEIVEVDVDKLESVSGGYPFFRDFSTGKEKEEQKPGENSLCPD